MAEARGEIYSTTVPCRGESLEVLEALCGAFIAAAGGGDDGDDSSRVLRLSVTEGCANALRQKPAGDQLAVVTLRFLRPEDGDHGRVVVEIEDPGRGLPIHGALPPYPEALLGRDIAMGGADGMTVTARVETPWHACVTCADATGSEPPAPRAADIAPLRGGGSGLLLVCRCWRRVCFTARPGGGSVLRLAEPRTHHPRG